MSDQKGDPTFGGIVIVVYIGLTSKYLTLPYWPWEELLLRVLSGLWKIPERAFSMIILAVGEEFWSDFWIH